MTLNNLKLYIGGLLKRGPDLRFVEKQDKRGRRVWTLVNYGAATKCDVLVSEYGEGNRLLVYVNLGPVAARTEVTLSNQHFRYCIVLKATYWDGKTHKNLKCAWYKNEVVPMLPEFVSPDWMPAEAFPGITRQSLLRA